MGLKIFRFGIGGFLLFIVSLVTARDQSIADSLVKVYEAFSAEDTSRFRVLSDIANNQTDPVKKLEYADLLVNEAGKTKNSRYLHHGYLNQGQAYRLLGDFDVAIYALLKALNYAEESDYLPGIAASNSALADVYSILGNHANAVLYYKRAIQQLPERTILKATVLLNLGDEYYLSKMYDSALACFEKSRAIYEEQGNDRSGLAYNLGNIGLVYAELGELEKARHSVAQSIHELEKLEDHYGIAIFLSYMAEIYQRKGLLETARCRLQYGHCQKVWA